MKIYNTSLSQHIIFFNILKKKRKSTNFKIELNLFSECINLYILNDQKSLNLNLVT